jgi:plasmid stability protein
MGQALIRNLDDALLADYREAAAANKRSLEAELREALQLARPLGAKKRREALAEFERIRLMTPPGVAQTPSEALVREDRDSEH